jgi:hypothetical protein
MQMAATPDTSDLRALARVILEQEELEQARHQRPRYDLRPVHRRLVEGVRIGFVLGIALGVASTGAGTSSTFRQPAWLASFVLFTLAGTVVGAVLGATTGVIARSLQRRRLDHDLALLLDEPAP